MVAIKEQHPTYLVQDLNDKKVFQVHVSQLRSFRPQENLILIKH